MINSVEYKKLIVKARKALDNLWHSVALRGRCWGRKPPKGKENPFWGSNITMGTERELVSISVDLETGLLQIHEFTRTKNTLLGTKVKNAFKKQNLKFKGEK